MYIEFDILLSNKAKEHCKRKHERGVSTTTIKSKTKLETCNRAKKEWQVQTFLFHGVLQRKLCDGMNAVEAKLTRRKSTTTTK